MKKQVILAAALMMGITAAFAQKKEVIKDGNREITITKDGDRETKVTVEVDDDKPPHKEGRSESREVIIRKDGDKETRMTLEINGDDVIVNGKPLKDFNEDGVKIRKKKMIIVNGEPLQMEGDDSHGSFSIKGWGNIDGNDLSIDGNVDDDVINMEKLDTVAFLGVTTEPSEKGIRVTEIVSQSAAEKAGLLTDDIITKVDGEVVTDPQSFTSIIRKHQPNDQIKIGYLRNGKEKSAKATLQEKIIKNNVKKMIIRKFNDGNAPEMFNFSMPNLSELPEAFSVAKKQKLGLKIQDTEEGNGVKVLDVEPGSVAGKAGLQKDDVVIEIDGEKISNTDEARTQLQENAERSAYKIKATRNGSIMEFDLKIPKKLKTADL